MKDDGPAISETIQHKIFDPFFTTKGVGEGTGLGLSVVHGIVKKHDGAIMVNSRKGEGACFSVLLPRLEHEDIEIKIEPDVDLPNGTEKILLVDDETALLNILDRILRNLGYDIQACSSSAKALNAFAQKYDYFDLLVTDQVMPDMTGSQLTREIRKLNPDIPVILFTGFTVEPNPKIDTTTITFNKILKKPLLNADLAFAVRKVLDERHK